MSKTYKNPNREKRIKHKESLSHEERRNVKRRLEDYVYGDIPEDEDYYQTEFDIEEPSDKQEN